MVFCSFASAQNVCTNIHVCTKCGCVFINTCVRLVYPLFLLQNQPSMLYWCYTYTGLAEKQLLGDIVLSSSAWYIFMSARVCCRTYMHGPIYAHMYVHMHACTRAYIHAYTYIFPVYTSLCIHAANKYTRNTYTQTNKLVHLHMFMHITHISTYIHA